MSYQAISLLTGDQQFAGRTQAAATEQAEAFRNDQREQFVALADSVLRGRGEVLLAFVRINAAAPGIGDRADNGDGTVDQSKITDADLLSLTQNNWQVVAGLYFDQDGTPLERMTSNE
jgi:hypothetical protein